MKRSYNCLPSNSEPYTRGLNLRKFKYISVPVATRFQWSTIQLRRSGNHQMEFHWLDNHLRIPPMSSYDMKVVRAQKFGHMYPYEIIRMLEGSASNLNIPHPDMRQGRFQEYDLKHKGHFIPVLRPSVRNSWCCRRYHQQYDSKFRKECNAFG